MLIKAYQVTLIVGVRAIGLCFLRVSIFQADGTDVVESSHGDNWTILALFRCGRTHRGGMTIIPSGVLK